MTGQRAVWVLWAAAAGCAACWLVPTADTYERTATAERARWVLGWPTAWYEATVELEAGIVARPPEFRIERRPLPVQGPQGIWRVYDVRVLDPWPEGLPSFTGWNQATLRRREFVRPWYGPLVPTLVGLGCAYVARWVGPDRTAPAATTDGSAGTDQQNQ